MLRIDAINILEDFFHQKKMITLDAIGREASDQTVDLYIRGFLRQVYERIQDLAPEFKTLQSGPSPYAAPSYNRNIRATPTHKHYPSQPYPMTNKDKPMSHAPMRSPDFNRDSVYENRGGAVAETQTTKSLLERSRPSNTVMVDHAAGIRHETPTKGSRP